MAFRRSLPAGIDLTIAGCQARRYSAPSAGTIPASKLKYVPTAGSYPKGFLAASAHVGVKPGNTRSHDLAIIASVKPCSAAAVFTQNKFQAAPVKVSRRVLQERGGKGLRALIVNSGCANAVTGKGGIEDAYRMAEETDKCLDEGQPGNDEDFSRTLVMSTGVIGQRSVSLTYTTLRQN